MYPLPDQDPRYYRSRLIDLQVYELMGLQEAATALTKKTFSDDILKIEICGPDEQHYSVVDVPGIFKRTTAGVTTREDIDLVRSMVLSNMKNARSVILAVVPSNVDIATQEILEMAEDYDPNGQRTLGVLTKPDLVDKGAEHNVVSIVEGKSHVLKLGWCIVKNPGQEEVAKSTEDRHVAEKNFFKTREPWSTLSKDRVGNEALRVRLVEILADMVQREFIKVVTPTLTYHGPKLTITTGQSRAQPTSQIRQKAIGSFGTQPRITGRAIQIPP